MHLKAGGYKNICVFLKKLLTVYTYKIIKQNNIFSLAANDKFADIAGDIVWSAVSAKLITILSTKYFFGALSSCFCRHEMLFSCNINFFCWHETVLHVTSTCFCRHQLLFVKRQTFSFDEQQIFVLGIISNVMSW